MQDIDGAQTEMLVKDWSVSFGYYAKKDSRILSMAPTRMLAKFHPSVMSLTSSASMVPTRTVRYLLNKLCRR